MKLRSFFAPKPGTSWFLNIKKYERDRRRPCQMDLVTAFLIGALVIGPLSVLAMKYLCNIDIGDGTYGESQTGTYGTGPIIDHHSD